MLAALLCWAFVQKGLKGSLPPQEIIEISYGSWQDFITVVEVDLGEQNTCRQMTARCK